MPTIGETPDERHHETIDRSRTILFEDAHLSQIVTEAFRCEVGIAKGEGSVWSEFGAAWNSDRSADAALREASCIFGDLSAFDSRPSASNGLDLNGFPSYSDGVFERFGGQTSDIKSCDASYFAGLDGAEPFSGQIIATFPAGWSPQMAVKSKGIILKMPETFRFRNYSNLPRFFPFGSLFSLFLGVVYSLLVSYLLGCPPSQ